MKLHLAIGVLTLAFSAAGIAQPAGSEPGAASKQAQERKNAAGKANYAPEDCRKDLANAREAQQAGHITEKEYAEQKKMAQTKVDRDAGRAPGGTANTAPCE